MHMCTYPSRLNEKEESLTGTETPDKGWGDLCIAGDSIIPTV